MQLFLRNLQGNSLQLIKWRCLVFLSTWSLLCGGQHRVDAEVPFLTQWWGFCFGTSTLRCGVWFQWCDIRLDHPQRELYLPSGDGFRSGQHFLFNYRTLTFFIFPWFCLELLKCLQGTEHWALVRDQIKRPEIFFNRSSRHSPDRDSYSQMFQQQTVLQWNTLVRNRPIGKSSEAPWILETMRPHHGSRQIRGV